MLKKKDNKTINKSIDLLRIIILSVLFCLVIFLFTLKLFDLQILNTKKEEFVNTPKVYKTGVLETSRGHIYDRNGVTLVSNKKVYNVIVDKKTIDSSDYNTVLLSFIDLCQEHGVEIKDVLPISKDYPYTLRDDYILDDKINSLLTKFIKNFAPENHGFYTNENEFYSFLCEKYNVSEESAKQERFRALIGIRYGMDTNDFEYLKSYTLLEDIDENFRTVVSENLQNLHGISVVSEDERYYNQGSLACHIIGRIGKMGEKESELYYKDGNNGYNYDDLVGTEGAEKAFEQYLHGVDGLEQLALDEYNNVVGRQVLDAGKGGYSVYLTIDSGLQKATENALKEQIEYARAVGNSDSIPFSGEDCFTGSAVVMNAKTGEIYASVSFPGYDLNTFSEDFNMLNTDTVGRPLFNRATQGIYPPGSTFKIATAIAALSEGVITPNTTIYDKVTYEKYPDYSPKCWISKQGGSHEYVNVKQAIEKSCNYFFYSVGDKMGIDSITKYASLLGLGESTGVEIPESTGNLASPKTKDIWMPGDTLQAAIGQSDNVFTPLQLCSYMSAVVNGGTRYKATLLNSVVDFYTGEVIYSVAPTVQSEVELPEDMVSLLKSAMKSVVVDGTARRVFDNYEYEIGGKTGTAQVSGATHKTQSDNALFVGFAPYDDPEIVVSVVVEHGDDSARASEVARVIFDYYFETMRTNGESDESR